MIIGRRGVDSVEVCAAGARALGRRAASGQRRLAARSRAHSRPGPGAGSARVLRKRTPGALPLFRRERAAFIVTHYLCPIIRSTDYEIALKESPPPYSVNDSAASDREQHASRDRIDAPVCEVLDLLADCKITAEAEQDTESEEYAEIRDMGLWHSTPLAHRHKSKISLTWVLKENLENTKLPIKKIENQSEIQKTIGSDVDRLQRQRFNDVERQRKCNRDVRDRVVGRNEYYHNLKFRSACEEFVNGHSCSDDTSVTEEHARRKHKHRHRRKNKSHYGKFGYDIRDLDSFLSEASIDRPGNIPVVIAYPSTLYQTHKECERQLSLPLGTVVNAVFKSEHWVYAQTPHGEEGYVLYAACLPLGILPARPSLQKKTPCWESSTDIYPRPCGNLTDTEKEQLRGRARSESRHRARRRPTSCAERNFDSLYLRTKSVNNLHEPKAEVKNVVKTSVKRHTLLVVNTDYTGSEVNRTLSVQKGDVVVLVQGGGETDVDAEWFYVRRRDGCLGFIPAGVAGYGYI